MMAVYDTPMTVQPPADCTVLKRRLLPTPSQNGPPKNKNPRATFHKQVHRHSCHPRDRLGNVPGTDLSAGHTHTLKAHTHSKHARLHCSRTAQHGGSRLPANTAQHMCQNKDTQPTARHKHRFEQASAPTAHAAGRKGTKHCRTGNTPAAAAATTK
jgi:GH25 family lysozyme M1 (1,4-beta-N-acetylmuramidase)